MVFCKKCKHYSGIFDIDIPLKCKQNYQLQYDWHSYRKIYDNPQEKNKNNDCPYFEPCFTKRIMDKLRRSG